MLRRQIDQVGLASPTAPSATNRERVWRAPSSMLDSPRACAPPCPRRGRRSDDSPMSAPAPALDTNSKQPCLVKNLCRVERHRVVFPFNPAMQRGPNRRHQLPTPLWILQAGQPLPEQVVARTPCGTLVRAAGRQHAAAVAVMAHFCLTVRPP